LQDEGRNEANGLIIMQMPSQDYENSNISPRLTESADCGGGDKKRLSKMNEEEAEEMYQKKKKIIMNKLSEQSSPAKISKNTAGRSAFKTQATPSSLKPNARLLLGVTAQKHKRVAQSHKKAKQKNNVRQNTILDSNKKSHVTIYLGNKKETNLGSHRSSASSTLRQKETQPSTITIKTKETTVNQQQDSRKSPFPIQQSTEEISLLKDLQTLNAELEKKKSFCRTGVLLNTSAFSSAKIVFNSSRR
jgi:hypothetical protein